MKLQSQLPVLVKGINDNKDKIVRHYEYLKNNREKEGYKDLMARFSWDVIRYIYKSEGINGLYDRYKCDDTHISTLAKTGVKEVLPEIFKEISEAKVN